ncbi:MAG: ATP-binding cassette domain-containing protein [Mycoplasmataceae bacterium]|jgi:Fe-S cluster assembly ATP-binding protein|nr:ATP-binding cassette domain-containing protein [Mycoplasmataceae bacterium]
MKFEIKNLQVKINNKIMLDQISFSLKTGDVLLVSGNNGSGKTTLLKTIMKHFSIAISKGNIILNSVILNKLNTKDIAKLGIFYLPQNSIELQGIQTLNFLRIINDNNKKIPFPQLYKSIDNFSTKFNLNNELLLRSLNVGFSGGQKKKIELLQSQIFDAQMLLIDEIDSGVDHDSINKIIEYINRIKKDKIIIIVSHNFSFIKKINPNKVILINQGKIIKIGDNELVNEIETKGVNFFIKNIKKKYICKLIKK